MKHKQLILILTVISILSASVGAAGRKKETLKIYLPREITVEDSSLKLGQVTIIRGSESVVSRASNIAMGFLATPQESITIDKNTVLSRLASNDIAASCVTFTGAEETVVHRQHQRITGKQFEEQAAAFLKNHLPDDSICDVEALHLPGDLILPGIGKNIKFTCNVIQSGRNQGKVQVTVLQENQQVGQQEVTFQFRYRCRKATTKVAVEKGTLLSTDNITIENGISDHPEPSHWSAPYGLVATRSLPANTVITANMVSTPQPQVLLKRNQSVAIKIENAGLLATATGKALQDGAVGDYIKVQNVDSKIVITAKVNEDGTVEPVF